MLSVLGYFFYNLTPDHGFWGEKLTLPGLPTLFWCPGAKQDGYRTPLYILNSSPSFLPRILPAAIMLAPSKIMVSTPKAEAMGKPSPNRLISA